MNKNRFMPKQDRNAVDILRDPYQNKGLSFTGKERGDLKLTGLISALVDPVTDGKEYSYQERLSIERLKRIKEPLDKYDYLMRLFDTDKLHFFRLFNKRPTELMPLIYTPTVGVACQEYSLVHAHGRGLFIPLTEAANIRSILNNWPQKDVRAIVVTDGERILGLGDLGSYGMGIPVGKLALCTGFAGIRPELSLPILLDVGTNNHKLLDDPLYFGIRARRAVGDVYDNFVHEFMRSCVDVFGRDVLIQFEDFGNENAFKFLKKYRLSYCMFNDDIQGTAAVVLSGLLSAARKTERRLKEENIVCFGAGESMLGFARLLLETLKLRCNLSTEEAKERLYMVDSRGLLVKGRALGCISKEKEPFCRPEGTPELRSLTDIIKMAKCTVLVGAAAMPHAFNDEILRTLAQQYSRPLIFALSNPTEKAECTAIEAYRATKGQCVYASGSPFPPVNLDASEVPPFTSTYRKPGQANNAYIYPGIMLAVTALRIHPITDLDFITAAETLSENVTDLDLCLGSLYPPLEKLRYISYAIARQVGHVAFKEGRCWLRRCDLKEEEIDETIQNMASYPDPLELTVMEPICGNVTCCPMD